VDFARELPKSEVFNAMIVVIDQFPKVQHYLLAMTTLTTADVANAYINFI